MHNLQSAPLWAKGTSENQPESLVPFNRPAFIGTELEAVYKAVMDNTCISGVGPFTRQCEELLGDMYGSPVLLASSCTHALEMAAHLLKLEPGDEVIVPSYTFVSTANAFALRGCTIRFADCDAYGQLCLDSLEAQITPFTKAVCVVHYAGNSCNMDRLAEICKNNALFLVEDAAQAINARYKGRLLGTWGDLACLSFHETKNITSGEGGALIVNNRNLLDRAQVIREKGTNRVQFFQGLTDKYTWVDIGSSYVMSDMNAAYLWVQLNHLDKIEAKRQQLWMTYKNKIEPLLEKLGAAILETPLDNTPNYHMFALVFDDPGRRPEFIQFMKALKIVTPFHYVALHESPMGQQYATQGEFPYTRRLSHGLVRLPLFYNMTSWHQQMVIEAIQDFVEQV